MVVEDVDHEITFPYKLNQCSNIPEGELCQDHNTRRHN